ncbi:hypothetical protein AEGHOMDF_3362 [Methylobacterium soli]|nr:hypothetical protein AEGHOMDF_3362 [Methylobacterium soli]
MERRKSARWELQRIGKLHLDGTSYPIGCLVLNVSEAGALIEVGFSEVIPDGFRLTVEGDVRDRRCKVTRRKQRTLAVAFAA